MAKQRLDTTLDFMSDAMFCHKIPELVKKLTPQTHFHYKEVQALLLIYHKVKLNSPTPTKYMTRTQFFYALQIAFDMVDDFMMDRICHGLNIGKFYVTRTLWVKAMSLFLRGTLQEKIKYCFKVYDVSGSGLLDRNVMIHFLNHCVAQQVEGIDMPARELVEIFAPTMDLDADNAISFADYKGSVDANPGLLECFGQCLPDRVHVNAFLMTMTNKF